MLFVIIDLRSGAHYAGRSRTRPGRAVFRLRPVDYRRKSSLKCCSSLCEMCEISANAAQEERPIAKDQLMACAAVYLSRNRMGIIRR